MLMLSGAACQNRGEGDTTSGGSGAGDVKAAADACSHCPGVQTAKADGSCPVCGMNMKKTGT
jgi:hypothetical protein